MPYLDPETAVSKMLRAFPSIPAWPQLPNRSFLENMYVQYSEGLPCLVVDRDRKKIYFDTERDTMQEMEAFYGRVIAGDLDAFAIGRDYASGFHCFVERLSGDSRARAALSCVKGQIVGPISFGLTVSDQTKRALLYHDELMDAAVKSIAMRAAWQARQLKKICDTVMIWLDEPYLASFGSGYVSLSEGQVLSLVGEVVQSIHDAGALAGIHCCGNTDWSLLMKTDLDIINFDAYSYFTGMTLYPDALRHFIGKGKMLAFGIVPTSDRVREETPERLLEKLAGQFQTLGEKIGMPAEDIARQCLITPSCGTGTLAEELADRVFELIGKMKLTLPAPDEG